MLVMLKKGWPGSFGRSVRDAAGKILERLTFQPGVPVEVTDVQYQALERDREIGTIVDVEPVGPAKVRVVTEDGELGEKLAAKVPPHLVPDADPPADDEPGEDAADEDDDSDAGDEKPATDQKPEPAKPLSKRAQKKQAKQAAKQAAAKPAPAKADDQAPLLGAKPSE